MVKVAVGQMTSTSNKLHNFDVSGDNSDCRLHRLHDQERVGLSRVDIVRKVERNTKSGVACVQGSIVSSANEVVNHVIRLVSRL